jgi:hypothetical protein
MMRWSQQLLTCYLSSNLSAQVREISHAAHVLRHMLVISKAARDQTCTNIRTEQQL